jgi:hypothetical protein
MRIPRIHTTFLLLAVALATTTALAQTSISASVYGAFSGTTTGNGTTQSPANQAGGLVEVRHISNPILGFEATYSLNRADQNYSNLILPSGPRLPLALRSLYPEPQSPGRRPRSHCGLGSVRPHRQSSPLRRPRGRPAPQRPFRQSDPHHYQQRRELDQRSQYRRQHLHHPCLRLRSRSRLGSHPAHRPPPPVPRQPLQSARPQQALYLHRRLHPHR